MCGTAGLEAGMRELQGVREELMQGLSDEAERVGWMLKTSAGSAKSKLARQLSGGGSASGSTATRLPSKKVARSPKARK